MYPNNTKHNVISIVNSVHYIIWAVGKTAKCYPYLITSLVYLNNSAHYLNGFLELMFNLSLILSNGSLRISFRNTYRCDRILRVTVVQWDFRKQRCEQSVNSLQFNIKRYLDRFY